jgi:hypothetical protein
LLTIVPGGVELPKKTRRNPGGFAGTIAARFP